MAAKRGPGFWVLISVALFLNTMMLVGQTGALINYEFSVSIGLQESAEEVTEVGVAWAKGFAFGDTLVYLPLFIMGIVGLLKRQPWGMYSMFGALAITAYWSLVSLYAFLSGLDAMNLGPGKYIFFSIGLPLIAAYGLWGMVFLFKNRTRFLKEEVETKG